MRHVITGMLFVLSCCSSLTAAAADKQTDDKTAEQPVETADGTEANAADQADKEDVVETNEAENKDQIDKEDATESGETDNAADAAIEAVKKETEQTDESAPRPSEAPVALPKTEKSRPSWMKFWDMSEKSLGSVGLGLGMQYGFFGINAEIAPVQFRYWELIHLVASFGITPDEILAYSGGLRIYALGSDSMWRPRVTVSYGINAQLVIDEVLITDDENIKQNYHQAHHGLIVATGVRFLFGKQKRHGLDIDLNIIPFSSINKKIDDLEEDGVTDKDDKPFPLALSFGYRFAF